MKFLYCIQTELWGHRKRARAENGEIGISEVSVVKANPYDNEKA